MKKQSLEYYKFFEYMRRKQYYDIIKKKSSIVYTNRKYWYEKCVTRFE